MERTVIFRVFLNVLNVLADAPSGNPARAGMFSSYAIMRKH
jgi:hypothetical protein